MLQVWKDRSHGAGMQGGRLSGSFFQIRVRGDRERRKKDDEMNFWRIKKKIQPKPIYQVDPVIHTLYTLCEFAHMVIVNFLTTRCDLIILFFLFVSRFLLFVGIHFRELVVVDVFFGHS